MAFKKVFYVVNQTRKILTIAQINEKSLMPE